MTIKVYISGICGSHEVRKQQQRVLFILQSLPIDLKVIDITEPGREEDLIFMQEEAKKHDKKMQLPPQIFNNEEYCGDYADFEVANDDDEIMRFLKVESSSPKDVKEDIKESIKQNGISDHMNNQDSSVILDEEAFNNIEKNDDSKDLELELNDKENITEETKLIEVPESKDANEEIVNVNEAEDKIPDKSDEQEESEESE